MTEFLAGISLLFFCSFSFYGWIKNSFVDTPYWRITSAVMAFGVSIGIFSAVHFDLLCASASNEIILAALFVISIAIYLLTRLGAKAQRIENGPAAIAKAMAEIPLSQTILAALFIGIGFCFFNYVLHLCVHPNGDFDALMVHNLRARFFARTGDAWHLAFSPELFWSNLDYPLLVPSFIAWLWRLLGSQPTLILSVIAAFFSCGCSALVYCGLGSLRPKNNAAMALLVLLSTPYFWDVSGDQFADVPMSFYLTSTALLLFFIDTKCCLKSRVIFIVGILVGCMIWTKNEGIYITAAFLITRAISFASGSTEKIKALFEWTKTELLPIAIGALPVISALLVLRSIVGTSNWLTYDTTPEQMLRQLFSIPQVATITFLMVSQIVNFGAWLISPVPLLALYYYFYRRKLSTLETTAVSRALLAILLIFLIETLIFIITTKSVIKIGFSSGRLLLQLYPTVVFMLMFAIEVPAPESAGRIDPKAEPSGA
jgi:Dolichyl-phosphate-mannose-protein mannosyltransferase